VSGGTSPKKSLADSAKKAKRTIITVIIILLAGYVLLASVYTVNDKQQAVVTTFGKVTSVADPGIHIKLPFGIQKATLVDVNVLQKIEIGFRSSPSTPYDVTVVESESKMISGDYNIVNCDFFVEYKISDPVKYLYNSETPDAILKSLAQSHIRNVISSYTVDQILTTGKGEIQTKIKESIIEELSVYDLGLVLTDIKLQDSEPPTEAVKKAFKDVETAKQERETAVNVANAYKNEQIPKAEAEADRLIADAELAKQQRINEANAQVASFNAMYGEYTQSPDVTRKRMFFEMVEKVLPGAKVYIDTSDGTTQKLLPIDSFNN
jgi:membrane protease subunit HflK